jgi:ferric-dicitrate binding protein FerR (iron transport regulator)
MKRTPDDYGERGEGGTGGDGRAGEIEQQAAEWVARIDLRGTPEEWAALDAWLAATPRHRAAFLRLSVAWRRADQLKKLAPSNGAVDPDLFDPARLDAMDPDEHELDDTVAGKGTHATPRAVPSPASRVDHPSAHSPSHARRLRVVASNARPLSSDRAWAAVQRYREHIADAPRMEHNAASNAETPSRLKRFMSSRLAASVVGIAIAVGSGGLYLLERSSADVYTTRVGEFHRVSLNDGSSVSINTDSEVRVRYTNSLRRVELVRGEALFRVAKNTERPFDVTVGRTTVRAVGTAFSVRLHDENSENQVDVVVAEGRIAINPPSRQTYPAGTVATVRNGRVSATTLHLPDITSRLAWTEGRLVFQGEKLSEVVEVINRYNLRQFEIADPDIASLRIGGTFVATDPDGFAKALDVTLGIKSRVEEQPFGPDVIRLVSGVP